MFSELPKMEKSSVYEQRREVRRKRSWALRLTPCKAGQSPMIAFVMKTMDEMKPSPEARRRIGDVYHNTRVCKIIGVEDSDEKNKEEESSDEAAPSTPKRRKLENGSVGTVSVDEFETKPTESTKCATKSTPTKHTPTSGIKKSKLRGLGIIVALKIVFPGAISSTARDSLNVRTNFTGGKTDRRTLNVELFAHC